MALSRCVLTVASLCLPLLAWGSCAPEPAPAKPPNVVFVLLDTVRADRMSLQKTARKTTPRIAEWARGGAVFEDAQSQAPWTLPSMASLFTGVVPPRHQAGFPEPGVRHLDKMKSSRLSDAVPTMAERLSAAGWRTEAFVTNPIIAAGLERGWDDLKIRLTEGADVATFAEQAIPRLAAGDDPFCLWLHFMDAHDPLLVPNDDIRLVAVPKKDPASRKMLARQLSPRAPTEWAEARFHVYDGSLHYLDRQVARVLAALDAAGVADDTIVVLTSDHGDEFHDHKQLASAAGYSDPRGFLGIGHGHTLFAEQLHVPLVIVGPGVPPARHERMVGLIDVVPTVLELLGLEAPAGVDGRSLVPLLSGKGLAPRPLWGGSLAYGPDRTCWITEEWKLIRGGEGERDLLFRRDEDPTEYNDRLQGSAKVGENMGRLLDMYEASLVPYDESNAVEHDQETLELLDAIGYGGSVDNG